MSGLDGLMALIHLLLRLNCPLMIITQRLPEQTGSICLVRELNDMDNLLERRILAYIRNNQPVKLMIMLSDLNIRREDYYSATLFLRRDRKIISTGRFGIFAGDDAYTEWRTKHKF
ncbi:hypothetical protein DO795_10640 [Salmonella enterica subsp. enterica serovar Newport]|nr:hypothetical protein [Salmonella enterica subsp. enterica serovar Newport]